MMRIISCCSSKGGSCKSTTCASLAVEAVRRGERVALLNLDPQPTLEEWHARRGSPENPALRRLHGSLARCLDKIEDEGFTLAIIDTPPAYTRTIESAIAASDFVLVPLQPSLLDLEAAEVMMELCGNADKPFAFLLSAAPPQRAAAEQSADMLSAAGPVLKTVIVRRVAHVRAISNGQTAGEIDGAAQAETAALWKEVSSKLPKDRV